MRRSLIRWVLCLAAALLCSGLAGSHELPLGSLAPPVARARKWRLGYLETKPFTNYASTLANIAFGLRDLGWISGLDGLPYTPGQTDTRALWGWLSGRDLGPHLEFAADGYYTYQGLKGPEITRAAELLARRLRDAKDLDLLIAMGTEAGKTLAVGAHRTPVLVFSTSDAVKAGIIKSVEDPGQDHVWAHMDPNRYRRQIEIFHDIFRFRKLGLAYEDSKVGRTYAAVEDVEAVAKERGFEVVREFVQQPDPENLEGFYAALAEAHRRLAPRVDAAYFGLFIGVQPGRLAEVFAPFVARKIPLFAQQAPDDVRHGALMSVSRANFKGIGRFGAEAIVQVLRGTPPRRVGQVYENSPNIILNLEVARAIGYKPSFDILLVADEIIQSAGSGKPTGGRKPQ